MGQSIIVPAAGRFPVHWTFTGRSRTRIRCRCPVARASLPGSRVSQSQPPSHRTTARRQSPSTPNIPRTRPSHPHDSVSPFVPCPFPPLGVAEDRVSSSNLIQNPFNGPRCSFFVPPPSDGSSLAVPFLLRVRLHLACLPLSRNPKQTGRTPPFDHHRDPSTSRHDLRSSSSCPSSDCNPGVFRHLLRDCPSAASKQTTRAQPNHLLL